MTHASSRSIDLIESVGGKVVCYDFDRATLRAVLKPERFLGPPLPSSSTDENVAGIINFFALC